MNSWATVNINSEILQSVEGTIEIKSEALQLTHENSRRSAVYIKVGRTPESHSSLSFLLELEAQVMTYC